MSGFNVSCAMLLPVVTYMTRQLGMHAVMLLGCILKCAGYILASLLQRFSTYILTRVLWLVLEFAVSLSLELQSCPNDFLSGAVSLTASALLDLALEVLRLPGELPL